MRHPGNKQSITGGCSLDACGGEETHVVVISQAVSPYELYLLTVAINALALHSEDIMGEKRSSAGRQPQ